MAKASTPLGRLHDLLSNYEEVREDMGEGSSVRQVWGVVLGVPLEQVALELANLGAELLPAAAAQVNRADDRHQQAIWSHHWEEWAAPILHENAGLDSTSSNLPARSLIYLAGLWRGLEVPSLIEGQVPSEQRVRDLISDLQGVRDSLEHDDEFPAVVRSALSRRLSETIDALADLRRNGPAGAQEAAKRILGEVAIAKATARKDSSLLRQIVSIAWTTYLAVAPLSDAVTSVGIIESTVETIAGEIVDHIPGELPQRPEGPGAVTDGTEQP
ncbi:hypothetical protein [Quadrisphaera granulorum]|nr:hypothetical protein [Quadrisphaera granulorum]